MKKKHFEKIEYVLPSYWANTLINGDSSGLEDDELATIDKFISDVESEHGHALFSSSIESEEYCFCKYHDANYLGVPASDCFTYILTA